MSPALDTPPLSGTATPTTASSLTQSGIKNLPDRLNGHAKQQAPLDASRMTVELTENPRSVPDLHGAEALAQKTCTDHMVTARWTLENGWDAPELKPYGPFSIMPTASVLHYATECFEGLKLYRGYDGKLRLFRVSRNCERMRNSAARIALPDFDPKELEKMIVALCAQDGPKWLSKDRAGSFLYLRPTMIATDPALGVQRPKEALLYIIIAVFPDMSKSLATPAPTPTPAPPALSGSTLIDESTNKTSSPASPGLKLLASNEDTIRAWPGGFGYAKLGANYGPSLVAQGEARARGFDQVLWLFGAEAFVTEAGASNFFVVIRDKSSDKIQLITAPLEERIILEGVTRASVLQLARERLGHDTAEGVEAVEVVEKRFTMQDLIDAHRDGRLVEAFAAGTAFFIAPVSLIHYRGNDMEIATGKNGEAGEYTRVIKQWLVDIMYGNQEHAWGVVVQEKE